MQTAYANKRLQDYTIAQDEVNFEQAILTQVRQFELLYLHWKTRWRRQARPKQIPPEDTSWRFFGIKSGRAHEAVALARDSGHAGLVFDVRQATELAEAQGIDALRALFADAGVIPASWSVPGSATDDPAALAERAELPRYAAVAADLERRRGHGRQPVIRGRQESCRATHVAHAIDPVTHSGRRIANCETVRYRGFDHSMRTGAHIPFARFYAAATRCG